MSQISVATGRAQQDFVAAEGQFSGAFNSAMRAKGFDASAATALLSGLQRQAQGLAALARQVSELQAEVEKLKRGA